MKQPHDMLIEGNHEKLYPEKSSGSIRLNQLSVVWFFIWSIMAKKNKMENKLDFFGFSSIFHLRVGESISGWMNSCCF